MMVNSIKGISVFDEKLLKTIKHLMINNLVNTSFAKAVLSI